MKLTPRPVLVAPLALLLLASTGVRDRIAFAPEEGMTLTKLFEMEGIFDLDNFSANVDGQDMGAMLGAFELTMDMSTEIEVSDTYTSMGSGRPKKLERTFETIAGESSVSIDSQMGSESQATPVSSDLEGESVVFTLDEESGEYIAEFEGESGDSDLLEGLEEEMDLRFLLPDGEVSVDDTWEVPVKALAGLLLPGGDLGLGADEDLEDEGMAELLEKLSEQFADDLESLLEGTCLCTFKGCDEDGIALITLEIEIGSAVDIVDMLTAVVESFAEEAGEDVPIEFDVADLNLDVEAEGTLEWNTEAGHAQSLELASDGEIGFDVALSADTPDGSHSAELSIEMSFSLTNSASFE